VIGTPCACVRTGTAETCARSRARGNVMATIRSVAMLMPMPIVSTVVQEEAAAATYLEAISPRTDTASSRKRRRTTSATIASAKPTAAGADCASIKQPALPARCGRTAPPATPFRTAPVPTACASNVTRTDARGNRPRSRPMHLVRPLPCH